MGGELAIAELLAVGKRGCGRSALPATDRGRATATQRIHASNAL
ncbi:MAG: hypothetical protein WB781_00495 [Candidatus Sulfotelmatobacter sp.]